MTEIGAWTTFTQFADQQVQVNCSLAALQQAVASSHAAINTLRQAGLAELASSHVLKHAEDIMRHDQIPRLWAALETAPGSGAGLERTLIDSLKGLSQAVQQHEQLLKLLRANLLGSGPGPAPALPPGMVVGMCTRYQQSVAAMVKDAAPVSLTGMLETYFSDKLDEFHGKLEDEGEDISEPAEGPTAAAGRAADVMGSDWTQGIRDIQAALQTLGMQEECTSACGRAVCKHVRAYLDARPDWTQGLLQPALSYLGAVPIPVLALVTADREKALSTWAKRLQYYVYETVGGLRMGQFFDVVTDLPESQPALADVRECLKHTSSHARFIRRFGAAIKQRLLHPGAATPDIISQYVGCIKALREVDPAGILLNAVGGPIKAYLRSRRDTIRCILASLTDDHEGGEATHSESLFEELQQPPQPEEGDVNTDTDNWAAFQAALQWQPDPVEIDLLHVQRKERGTDIISMLVAIYGSKELFINEYRSMLAERLLAKGDYDCDKEIRTLELLKIRFGENSLLNCEIMLKDMADSKRTNHNIHHLAPQDLQPLQRQRSQPRLGQLSATIISSLYWPPHPVEDLTVPQQLQKQMAAYAARFHVVKTPRKLVWINGMGTVDLSLTVGGQEVDFTVAPVQAAIIMHFKDRPAWHAAELAAAVGMTADALRKRALFWISQGVLQETRTSAGTVYSRCERLEQGAQGATAGAADTAMDEDTDAPSAAEVQEQQEMAVYEQYIMGMLTNFDGGLPLERIHNMLKMFCSTPPYDRTAEQLTGFLASLVAADKIACEGAVYKKN